MSVRHFTDLSAVSEGDLRVMLDDAVLRKARLKAGERTKPLEGKVLAMIFDKPSTRTRVSFDVGMRQLGGETIMLTGTEMQLGRSETIADTAKVLSRYVDAIMIRTTSHERLLELTENANVPVINGLTDDTHPCQLMADIMTFEEHRGPVAGKTFAWTGDGNNVLHSLLEASARFRFNLNVAVPEGSEPDEKHIGWSKANGGKLNFTRSAEEAVHQADCVVTDCWVSMGQEHRARGHNVFLPYQVNAALMAKAKPDALFMHCLPAHRGEEVTDEVIDGPHSVVFDEAENRLHAQKAVLAWCLGA
ncbi:ornithine carbamoyltransferase [Mesorhizobium sp. M4B.F.Ca.ET.190.01.1.1]|uniref:ornithine carbamoyltransferase n=1 Tax=unclassified Mesorhizobium TaxID=325217 RepID=UPI000FEA79AD|nr:MULTISPECIES: ornithine carbamoyltransferase [unclassified Mesorhizobium]RWA61752.1 MAG: ornithine carbamoyltransferase [Mesorhizobium sp.]RWF65112.1 MAG: ornithine carbamoyltransferase [Mesorhizobium sp.]TGR08125.1 ornithine carbamoyltransferase [Mesorhizobium sp. M4B.F.Ca.ET.200.01.1.1]TGS17481.1 ornithine carbamoyltransferase [Mesorhizobium sp. M4B.F.Ca.ET.190.01.1.1]TGT29807.1 ornithine carbamoyltransferase [Mesorhizobium sp. M4B.F.Ca.ET.172.01.1.1]